MHARVGAVVAALTIIFAAACRNPFAREYEYEEQLYLDVSGAATVTIDASIPSLIALRGLALDPALDATVDRDQVRRLFSAGGCDVANVSRPWHRHGRAFVQVRVRTQDIRTLSSCAPLAWSRYSLEPREAELHYHQVVGAAAGADSPGVNWDGSELVAFKLHLPSRIRFQNARLLDRDAPRDYERGNIVTWEQWLKDRRAGKAIDIDVVMDATSILYTTLWLFAGAFAAAVIVLIFVVWRIRRRGRAIARTP